MTFDTSTFAEVFVTLLVIMDPVGNVPVFLALTSGYDPVDRRRAAWQSAAVAAGVIAVFASFGQGILRLLGISLEALQIAGGFLLLLVALELLQPGRNDSPALGRSPNVALVPLGTPLLAGPGAIAATMVFVRRASAPGEVAAIAAALVAVVVVLLLSLRFAGSLARVLRDSGIHLVTRIMGLLLAAIAVQLVADAIRAMIES